jgi:hypothetical protein
MLGLNHTQFKDLSMLEQDKDFLIRATNFSSNHTQRYVEVMLYLQLGYSSINSCSTVL